MEKEIKYGNRWGYLAKGFVMTLFLGILYAWSIFVLPLEEAFGWTRVETTWTYTIMMVGFGFGQLTGAYWGNKFGQVRAITLWGIVLTLGFFVTSFADSLVWLYVSYGAVCGYALGVALNNTLALAPRWFPDKSGLALGAMTMGFGLASLVLGSFANFLIAELGYQWAFKALSALCLIMVVGMSLFQKAPPMGYVPTGYVPPTNESSDISTGYTRAQMLKTPQFWAMYGWNLANHLAGFMVISLIAPYGVSLGMAAALAAVAMGLFGFFNGLGRPTIGALADKIGRKMSMILDNILMAIGLLCIAFLPTIIDPFVGTVIGAAIVGLSFGGSISIGMSVMRSYYGVKYVGANMGMMATVDIPTGIIGPMLAAFIFAVFGSYFWAFIIAAVILVVTLFLPVLIGKPIPVAVRFPEKTEEANTLV
ncbi:MAG: OFA family MFS transporter [Gordonibacter sp.]|nr:OFA family MFS transporter [Gordonibacter sp.]